MFKTWEKIMWGTLLALFLGVFLVYMPYVEMNPPPGTFDRYLVVARAMLSREGVVSAYDMNEVRALSGNWYPFVKALREAGFTEEEIKKLRIGDEETMSVELKREEKK